jgi:hypothetical protein
MELVSITYGDVQLRPRWPPVRRMVAAVDVGASGTSTTVSSRGTSYADRILQRALAKTRWAQVTGPPLGPAALPLHFNRANRDRSFPIQRLRILHAGRYSTVRGGRQTKYGPPRPALSCSSRRRRPSTSQHAP